MQRTSYIKNNFLEFYTKCQSDLKIHCQSLPFLNDPVKLKQHYNKHQIMYRQKDTTFKLSYDNHCKFKDDWNLSCRGVTIINNQFFYGLNKFVNEHEMPSLFGLTLKELLTDLTSQKFTFQLTSKYDGSYIQICILPHNDKINRLEIFTMRSIEAEIDNKVKPLKYADVILEHLERDHQDLYSKLLYDQNLQGQSLIGELCISMVPMINVYAKDFFKPILFIDSTGLPYDLQLSSKLTSIESYHHDVQTIFNEMTSNSLENGKNPEGCVLYACKDKYWFPLVKFKREEYLTVTSHKEDIVGSSDNLCQVQISYCLNATDDYKLEAIQAQHLKEFKEYLQYTAEKLEQVIKNISIIKDNLPLQINASNLPAWLKTLVLTQSSTFLKLEEGDGYSQLISWLSTRNRYDDPYLKTLQNRNCNWFQEILMVDQKLHKASEIGPVGLCIVDDVPNNMNIVRGYQKANYIIYVVNDNQDELDTLVNQLHWRSIIALSSSLEFLESLETKLQGNVKYLKLNVKDNNLSGYLETKSNSIVNVIQEPFVPVVVALINGSLHQQREIYQELIVELSNNLETKSNTNESKRKFIILSYFKNNSYSDFTKLLVKFVNMGYVIFVESEQSDGDYLKLLLGMKKRTAEVLLFSSVQQKSMKPHPNYLQYMSSVDDSKDLSLRLSSVIKQINNKDRKIKSINSKSIPTLNEIVNTIQKDVETKLNIKNTKINYYLGIPQAFEDVQLPVDFIPISHQHVVVVPPNEPEKILDWSKYIGEEIQITTKERVKNTVCSIRPVVLESSIFEENTFKAYITEGIKEGQSSLTGMYLAKDTIYEDLKDTKTETGYLVPL
jgi:hypothetical protein